MTVRERTKALTTGPGEKLRKALDLGPEHSGTCARLARALSQYKTEAARKPIRKLSGFAGGEPRPEKLGAMVIRIDGLVKAIKPAWQVSPYCPTHYTEGNPDNCTLYMLEKI